MHISFCYLEFKTWTDFYSSFGIQPCQIGILLVIRRFFSSKLSMIYRISLIFLGNYPEKRFTVFKPTTRSFSFDLRIFRSGYDIQEKKSLEMSGNC